MERRTQNLTWGLPRHRLRVVNPLRSTLRSNNLNTGVRFLAGLLLVSFVSGCKPDPLQAERQTRDDVRIAVTPLAGSTALFIAEERGFFRDEGLNVSLSTHESGMQAMALMLSGGADIATVGDTPVASAALEEKPVSVLATVCNNNFGNAILARRDRSISGAKDLLGKRVGRVPWTTADFFLHIYLTTSHVNPSGVELIDLGPTEVSEALLSGKVDAVATWAPYSITLAQRLGTNVTVLQDPTIYTMTWLVVGKPDWAIAEPRAVRKFLRALIKANNHLLSHPDEGKTVYARKASIPPSLASGALRGWDFSVTLDQSLVLGLEDQARWILKKRGIESTPPNFLKFIHADGLKSVQSELVTIPGK